MPTSLDTQVKDYLFGRTQVPDGKRMVLCQVCGKFEPKKVVYDGSGESVICDHCLERFKGLAYLLCGKCGRFLGFYKPGKTTLDSGVMVEIEAGDTLHTAWCDHCNPDGGPADITEFRDIMLQKNLEAPKKPILDPTGKPIKTEGL